MIRTGLEPDSFEDIPKDQIEVPDFGIDPGDERIVFDNKWS